MNDVSFYEKISDPIVAVKTLGEIIALSGMFGCKKTEQGCVIAWACLLEKRNPMDYLRTFHLNDGKLTKRADAMLAEFMQAGGTCVWKSALNDTKEARAVWTFGANKDLETFYSVEDANREGNAGKDTYKKSGPDMLRARLISKTIRMIAPQVVAGIYTEEELDTTTVRALADSVPPTAPEKAAAAITHEVGKKVETPSNVVPLKKEPAKEDEKELADAGLAPTQKAETKTEAPKPAEPTNPPTEGKPDNLGEVEKLLKENNAEQHANAWLLKNKWIKDGQTYADLNKGQCANILRRPPNFIKAIKG